jgi:hypothetical protein
MDHNRAFKGVWIPAAIWLDEGISPVEKVLLAEIESLDHGKGCFASNTYLAEFLHTSPNRVANLLSKLRKGGYLIDRSFDGRKRFVSTKWEGSLNAGVKAALTPGLSIDNSKEQSLEEDQSPDPERQNRRETTIPEEGAPPHSGVGGSPRLDEAGRQGRDINEAESLYKTYPRHTGKAAAIAAIGRALKKASFETLRTAVSEFAAAVDAWPVQERQFVPHPATWFNQERWNDDREYWKRNGKGSGRAKDSRPEFTEPMSRSPKRLV